jgi:Ca2+-transporting ATPase
MWFNKSFEETVKEFNSNILNGLSSEEAKMRLEKIGENKLISKKKESID